MVGWVSFKLPIARKVGQFQSAVDTAADAPVLVTAMRLMGVDGCAEGRLSGEVYCSRRMQGSREL
jgi:hypothetical protein